MGECVEAVSGLEVMESGEGNSGKIEGGRKKQGWQKDEGEHREEVEGAWRGEGNECV